MGGGNKTTTKSQSTESTQLPAWLTGAAEQTYNDARAANAANPVTRYTGQMTSGMTANQQAAQGAAAANAGTGQADLDRARMMTAGAAMAPTGRVQAGDFGGAEADRYMSPFLGQVQARTLEAMGRQNMIDRQSLGDQAQASKAYGGTRHAVEAAEQGRAQNSNMLDFLARSNQAGYENAQQQFERDRAARMSAQGTNASLDQADRDRLLTAGGQMGQIGQASAGLNSANIRDLLMTGGVAQDTENARLGADYDEFLRLQREPMDRYESLMGMLSGAPKNVTVNSSGSSTTKQKSGLMNQLMAGAQLGLSAYSAGLFSDRRLKKAIVRVGRMANGLGIYLYRYLWDRDDAPLRRGVMADEVAIFAPHALGARVGGFFTVHYDLLGEAV